MVSTQSQCALRYKQSQWRRLLYLLLVIGGGAGLTGNAIADIQVMSTFKAFVPSCDDGLGGLGVPANGLCFKESDGVQRSWADSNGYCNGLGGGYRLPTQTELSGLYGTYPNNKMNTVFGWQTAYGYWSSTQYGVGSHYIVGLGNGYVYNNVDSSPYYVTCVS